MRRDRGRRQHADAVGLAAQPGAQVVADHRPARLGAAVDAALVPQRGVPDDRRPGCRLDPNRGVGSQLGVRHRARQMGPGPHQGGAVPGVEVHQAPDHVQRHGIVRAAHERHHRVVLAVDVHLETLGRVALPRGHGNAQVAVVQQRVLTEHRAHDAHHRRVEVELVEMRVLADDGVAVAQIPGLRSRAARHLLLGVQQLAGGTARHRHFILRQRAGHDGVAPVGQLRKACVEIHRAPPSSRASSRARCSVVLRSSSMCRRISQMSAGAAPVVT